MKKLLLATISSVFILAGCTNPFSHFNDRYNNDLNNQERYELERKKLDDLNEGVKNKGLEENQKLDLEQENAELKNLEGKHYEGFYFPTQEEIEKMRDNKMTDPTILENDEEIKNGDLGTEQMFEEIQNPPTNETNNEIDKMNREMYENNVTLARTDEVIPVHHYWKYPQIHKVYPNPNIKAINGSYVNNVVGKAWDYIGTPYEYGSDRNNDFTFDCSDFVRWVHLWTLGMDLPKNSSSQYEYVKKFAKNHYTDLSQAKRGDILFFMSYKGWQEKDYKGVNVQAQPVAHNGIYAGNGILIHTASKKTGGVRFDEMNNTHLEYRFIGGASLF